MRLPLLALALASCRSPSTAPVLHGTASAPRATVTVASDQPLGWLGLGLSSQTPSWLPRSETYSATVITADSLPPKLTAIGATGPAQVLAVAPPDERETDCQGYGLSGVLLTGPRLPPGAVWVLPPNPPRSWAPAAIELHSEHADPARHDYVAGPLTITLTRTTDRTGRLQILRDGAQVHQVAFEQPKTSMRNPPAIDVAEGGTGVPQPIAVWSIAPAGPFIVVLMEPSFASVSLSAWLVEDRGARAIEGMGTYLEVCTF